MSTLGQKVVSQRLLSGFSLLGGDQNVFEVQEKEQSQFTGQNAQMQVFEQEYVEQDRESCAAK